MSVTKDYLDLTKPRITVMVLVTTGLGFLTAGGDSGWPVLGLVMAGVGLLSSGATTLNHVWEKETDALMRRTANRPLPAGRLESSSALVFGVLRQQQYLDFIVGTFAKHPLNKMKARTLSALRLGLFQLLILDRIPESAAVNETVKAFKVDRQPKWLVNFVNGVLRNAARNKHNLPHPSEAILNGLPILNHPDWLVNRWQRRFGKEKTVAICQLNNQQPPLTLRTNTDRISRNNLLKLLGENNAVLPSLPRKRLANNDRTFSNCWRNRSPTGW